MAKLADAQDLGSCPVRGGGSTPSSRILYGVLRQNTWRIRRNLAENPASRRFMLKRVTTPTILLCLLLFSSIAYGEAKSALRAGESISPVYEDMLAHQIYQLRKELIKQKTIQPEEDFAIMGLDREEHQLASEVLSHLKRNYPKVNWQPPRRIRIQGVLLMDGSQETDITKAAKFIQKGYLMVFGLKPANGELITKLTDAGFRLHSEVSGFELEYVKNDEGRQIIDLDEPYFTNQIFERLVKQEMNPVHAHLAAEQAIKDFRKLKELKLVIFGKIPA